MRRLALATTTAFLSLASLPAHAQQAGALQGFYIGGFGGVAYLFDQEIEEGAAELEIEYDVPGYVFGGQIGYMLDTNIRIEAEVSYLVADGDVVLEVGGNEIIDAGYDFSLISGTGGIFFDFWPVGSFVPYVGGGVGYSRAENEVGGIKDTQNAFTAFGEVGLPFALSPNVSLVPATRFSWVGTDEDVDEIFADNLFNAQLRVGARYAF